MSLQKNTDAQKWIVFAFDLTDGTAKTGDSANITANLRIDGGEANAVDDANPTELEDGYYVFDLTQAETNGNYILICPASSTENIQVIGCPMAQFTSPPNFNALSISSGRVDVGSIEGVDATNQIRDAVVDDATRIDASKLNTLSGHDPGEELAGEGDIGSNGDSIIL
jgi:hypothetical protein